jgi:hypothetical protein
MRWLLLLVVAATLSCGRAAKVEPLDGETAKANLVSQARELMDSTLSGDYERAMGFTHPKAVEMMGGKRKYVQVLKDGMASFQKDGVEINKISLDDPSAVVQNGNEHFSIVPQTLAMTFNKTKVGLQRGYLVALSTNGGRNWVFLDGAGIKEDRTKLKSLLPNFPDALELPKTQQLVMFE